SSQLICGGTMRMLRPRRVMFDAGSDWRRNQRAGARAAPFASRQRDGRQVAHGNLFWQFGELAAMIQMWFGHSVLTVVTAHFPAPSLHCVLVVLMLSGSSAGMRECDQRNPARYRPPAQPH